MFRFKVIFIHFTVNAEGKWWWRGEEEEEKKKWPLIIYSS